MGAPPTLSGGLLDYNNNVANAVYHGLTLTALERLGKYFNLTANYTYSHTIDNGNFTTFINLPPNQFDYASERANSNQDARHHFVTNFTVDAPQNSFLRNFEFSSIVTLQSGRPFTLFAGQNTFGDVAGLSTDRVGGAPVGSACSSVTNCSTIISRNTYVGDPLYSWDLRLSRSFPLTERVRMNLAVDAFNVLNRGNVDEVNSIYGSPAFCGASPVIPKHYNDATTLAIQQGGVSCATQQAAAAPPAWLGPGTVAGYNSEFSEPAVRTAEDDAQSAPVSVFHEVDVLSAEWESGVDLKSATETSRVCWIFAGAWCQQTLAVTGETYGHSSRTLA